MDHDARRGEAGAEGAIRDHAQGLGGVCGRGLDRAADGVSNAGTAAGCPCGNACGVTPSAALVVLSSVFKDDIAFLVF